MATGAAPGVSKTTKHQNFGSGRPHNAAGGYQTEKCNDGAAQSYANSFMTAPKSKKTKTKKQANHLHGSRAGG